MSRAANTGPPLLSLYAETPAWVRAHVRLRWWTCPFPAVEAHLPSGGRLLEVGCGHGLLSLLASLRDPTRRVRGVDVATGKIAHAEAAATVARRRGADCRFSVVAAGEFPDGPWDAIAIVDVLYLLDPAGQRQLLSRCVDQLAPQGTLAVKEMALAPSWKARWNRLQETLAVRILRITAGSGLSFIGPAQIGAWIVDDGLEVRHVPLHTGYPHPHHLVVGRRPAR